MVSCGAMEAELAVKTQDIRQIPIADISPAKYNPRKDLKPGDPAYDKLKKAVLEFGLVLPLVWNERSGNLVSGHQRLKILQERGDTTVPVVVVNVDDITEKAMNLALNKHSGEWDYASLADLLQELDSGAMDMDLTGFGVAELEQLMTWTPNEIEWEGMPRFESSDERGRALIIHFRNNEDAMKFSELLGQPITDRTKYLWFPPLVKDEPRKRKEVDE